MRQLLCSNMILKEVFFYDAYYVFVLKISRKIQKYFKKKDTFYKSRDLKMRYI